MVDINLGVRRPLLPHVRSGVKDLEVRVCGDYFNSVRERDTLVFNGEVRRKVKKIWQHKSFVEALNFHSSERIAPGFTRGEILSFLREIYGDKERFGVLVFELEKI